MHYWTTRYVIAEKLEKPIDGFEYRRSHFCSLIYGGRWGQQEAVKDLNTMLHDLPPHLWDDFDVKLEEDVMGWDQMKSLKIC